MFIAYPRRLQFNVNKHKHTGNICEKFARERSELSIIGNVMACFAETIEEATQLLKIEATEFAKRVCDVNFGISVSDFDLVYETSESKGHKICCSIR